MYSQKDEERIILEILGQRSSGFFIDVGAYDGIKFSNTRALVERGFTGIMVEPGLEAFQKLLENYRLESRILLLHAALSNHKGIIPFWSNDSTYSTTTFGNVQKFSEQGFSRRFFIPTISWNQLLDFTNVAEVDLLSIDTEGTSLELLDSFPFYRVQPKIIVVEHDQMQDLCDRVASNHFYRLAYANEENCIYTLNTP